MQLRMWFFNLLTLGGDIEENPGPAKSELILMTQNCRGLNDPNKLQLLLRNNKKNVRGDKFVPSGDISYE
jgi:hypothetical protein